ncbi:MAG: HAD family phosphatase [Parcubacteria group bacterium]|jgi:HAD superfamily hydrolase (TIGR01509 family)
MIKAILCDRDGVLLDSEIVNIQSSLETLKVLDVHPDEEDEMMIMGKHPLDYVDFFVGKYHINGEQFLALRSKLYNDLLANAIVFDDTVKFLLRAKRDFMLATALVTSANHPTTMSVLAEHHLADLFDAVVTFEDCAIRKPSAHPYLVAAQKLGVEPGQCVVIEDSPVGVVAAKSAGMVCIVRINAKNISLNFDEADLIVHNLYEARDFLSDLCKKE